MSKPKTFAEAFWGTDFCSTAGFEALKKRIKDGEATCRTYADHLKQRAKAEDDYGKALLRSCKLSPDLTESGNTMRAAVDSLKTETEKMANAHLELGNHLLTASQRMLEFMQRQKSMLKPRKDLVTQNIKTKLNLHKSVLEAKKQYEQRSQEAENAEIVYQKAANEQNVYTTKDYDKIVTNHKKTKQEAERACKMYEEFVSKLEAARLEWDANMTHFCRLCEEQEQARIKMMQNEMWVYCNMNSMTCVEIDECSEAVRLKLEQVDIDQDIQTYINTSGTGRERPAPIRFEEYRPQHQSHYSSTGCGSSATLQSAPTRPRPPDGGGGGYYNSRPDIGQPMPAGPSRLPRTFLPSQPNANGQLPYTATNTRIQAQPLQIVNKHFRQHPS